MLRGGERVWAAMREVRRERGGRHPASARGDCVGRGSARVEPETLAGAERNVYAVGDDVRQRRRGTRGRGSVASLVYPVNQIELVLETDAHSDRTTRACISRSCRLAAQRDGVLRQQGELRCGSRAAQPNIVISGAPVSMSMLPAPRAPQDERYLEIWVGTAPCACLKSRRMSPRLGTKLNPAVLFRHQFILGNVGDSLRGQIQVHSAVDRDDTADHFKSFFAGILLPHSLLLSDPARWHWQLKDTIYPNSTGSKYTPPGPTLGTRTASG
ncbi:hypothetical protein DFH08DRAFT_826871 [Mycena albidolilacea]|uniref:Uncharacterized protein n=1 Tax=Mycena albidolilacea TaxID=1033008 RepID=A0AAD6YZ85_9AGAR|nr:hypothetical protein DFH08DRAFT_826871 [Mycena albidolilacea]